MENDNMNVEEMKQANIDVYVILQQIKADPSKLDYFLRVYGGKLSALGVPLETYQI